MGPLIFLSLGASGLAFTVARVLTPYRPLFMILTIIFLGLAYHLYEKKGVKDRKVEIFFMIIFALVFIFVLAPVIYPFLIRQ